MAYEASADGKTRRELKTFVRDLEKEMQRAAADLEFERAAVLRDQIRDMRATLGLLDERPEWQRIRDPL
jgi:excinuclease ABC subunit B